MEYEVDGVMYNTQTELQLATLLNSYELYASTIDKMDVLSYYEK